MRKNIPIVTCSLLLTISFFTNATFAQKTDKKQHLSVEKSFTNPDSSARPWAFFWWFNGHLDKPAITNHLEELKAKGLGGVILYASEWAGIPKGAEFMGTEWRGLFKFAVQEAHRLGLTMGINICYGWPAGGKWITPENNTWITLSSSQIVSGPQLLQTKLIDPPGKNKLYRDVVVQAIKLNNQPDDRPVKITASSHQEGIVNLNDLNYFTTWAGQNDKPISEDNPQWLLYEYKTPQPADCFWLGNKMFDFPAHVAIQRSDDGINFTTLAEVKSPYLYQYHDFPSATAKYFRVLFKAGASNNRRIDICELAIGPKPKVMRVAQMATKVVQNNPVNVMETPARLQLDFAWNTLAPLKNEHPADINSIIDITQFCTADGSIKWNVPPGTWKIIRTGETANGVEAGGGLLVDFMNPKATNQHFSKFMKLLIEDAGQYAGNTFKYFHEDNNEILGPYNWTPQFIDNFKALRGYDPKPYIATLSGELIGSTDITDRFLHDYRRTIADLVADKHYSLLADSAHKYGMGMQSEGGGPFLPFLFPYDGLMTLGKMDIPAAEFWESEHWRENQNDPVVKRDRSWLEGSQNVDGKQAAIAGHIYGKKIIAAEAFTSLGATSHWHSAPADLLLHANIAFCEGINRFILHSSTTTKAEDGKPGYEYGAGTHFNQNVTWWKDVSPFFKFISRCEYLLQKGLFVADVLYYNGDDVPNVVTAKHIPDDLGIGYDYDACNTEVLLNRLAVINGRLVLPDGMSYSLLVLPNTRSVNLEALKKIKQLVNDGATIIGPKPEKAYGLKNYPESDNEIKNVAAELWGDTDGKNITVNNVGKGQVYWGKTAREVLANRQITPDLTYRSPTSNALIDFIHRRDGDMDIYYIANRRNETATANYSFRVSGKQPEIWNPFNGTIKNAGAFNQQNGTLTMPLTLAPYGSTFVIFRKAVSPGLNGNRTANDVRYVKIKEITGPYKVAFDTAWGGPASVEFAALDDWSKRPEEGIRYFSGSAKYFKQFIYTAQDARKTKNQLILDLGNVQNTARVKVNGKELAVLWCPPYQTNISAALKPGINHIEVEVTNTWVNRLTGDAKLPPAERRTKTNIGFSPNTPLKSSGLLGPVTLGYLEED